MSKKYCFALLALVAWLAMAIGAPGAARAAGTDGTLKWWYPINSIAATSPPIGPDGTIYAGSSGSDKNLYAINPNGTLKWKCLTGGIVSSSLAIGSDGTIYAGCSDNYLYAINTNGIIKWKFLAAWFSSCSPAIGTDGTIYISACDINNNYNNYLYAIKHDGTLKWQKKTECVIDAVAIAADGTIICSTLFQIDALRPDGTLKWSYSDYITSSPAIGADGTIYIGMTTDSSLCAIKPDGTLKWKYVIGTGNNDAGRCPVIGADGVIYFCEEDGLYALNPNGTLKWKFGPYIDGLFTDFRFSPALGADGTIYVGSYINFYFYAVNRDGTLKWKYAMNMISGATFSAPTIGVDGTVYVIGTTNPDSPNKPHTALCAFNTTCGGPATNAPWPLFNHDMRHTGNVKPIIPKPAINLLLLQLYH